MASGINERIARRVRLLRSELNLSLDALSEKCNVSRSMLSVIERGESSPTAVALEKIATGLGVSLAMLFDDPAAAGSPVSHGSERETWQDPQSGYRRRSISPDNFPSPIRIVEVELPAGARVAYEPGLRESHRQIWVQEGAIEVTIGPVTYVLAEDDCLASTEEEATTYQNRARKTARYYVILAAGGRS
jgi:transcriptional regulator with XRE-family HTH domain